MEKAVQQLFHQVTALGWRKRQASSTDGPKGEGADADTLRAFS